MQMKYELEHIRVRSKIIIGIVQKCMHFDSLKEKCQIAQKQTKNTKKVEKFLPKLKYFLTLQSSYILLSVMKF